MKEKAPKITITEQFQRLDIKMDTLQCDILSQKQSNKKIQENSEKAKSDTCSLRKQIDYLYEELNTTKSEILMMKTR